ncbi:Retron-type RNA-directed DNA polymerase [uncultured Candidatus Thioglobus sp.]|nr:Retron-type RNA-directed DNA polymerase [uncultured Candidatus Thioglobus sp.]
MINNNLQQSFNSENFIKIFYEENRKGFYIESAYNIFKPVKKITDSISEINKKFKSGEYKDKDKSKLKANRVKNKLKNKKYKKLKKIFEELEDVNIQVSLNNKNEINNKTVYGITELKDPDKPEVFFALKQIQKNIKKSFGIQLADRYVIVKQVINMLNDDMPKIVIRTDIKSFFESVPHKKLKNKLSKNHILNHQSKKIIDEILERYQQLSNTNKGIPRGVGISSYLAELYMRDIDNKIKALPNLTYYARYVDDIVLIFTPKTKYDKVCYLKKIVGIVENEELKLNKDKTKSYNLCEDNNIKLDFLGYEISKQDKNPKINVSLTNSKIQKYRKKIKSVIEDYENTKLITEYQARRLLKNRLKYLTGNTRLLNAKKDILIGIYFSNILLTNTNQLDGLDKYLQNKLPTELHDKFKKYTFKQGFIDRKFYKFNKKQFKNILSIWKKV